MLIKCVFYLSVFVLLHPKYAILEILFLSCQLTICNLLEAKAVTHFATYAAYIASLFHLQAHYSTLVEKLGDFI